MPSAALSGLSAIHAVQDQFDQPFVDRFAVPMYILCHKLRKHVKVVIGGDGGDETFGGYARSTMPTLPAASAAILRPCWPPRSACAAR